jgi:hypothetical protein
MRLPPTLAVFIASEFDRFSLRIKCQDKVTSMRRGLMQKLEFRGEPNAKNSRSRNLSRHGQTSLQDASARRCERAAEKQFHLMIHVTLPIFQIPFRSSSASAQTSNICKTSAFNPFTQWPLSPTTSGVDQSHDAEKKTRRDCWWKEKKKTFSRDDKRRRNAFAPLAGRAVCGSCLAKGLDGVDKCFCDNTRLGDFGRLHHQLKRIYHFASQERKRKQNAKLVGRAERSCQA